MNTLERILLENANNTVTIGGNQGGGITAVLEKRDASIPQVVRFTRASGQSINEATAALNLKIEEQEKEGK